MWRALTIQELQRAKDECMCNTINELYDEMELWQLNAVQHNRWGRALKASNRVGVRPMWYTDELEDGEKKLSWATGTRSLRKLRARITHVVGKQEQPREQTWRLEDAAQWELLFRGEEVFWKSAKAQRKAGHEFVISLNRFLAPVDDTVTTQPKTQSHTKSHRTREDGGRHRRSHHDG